MNTLFKISSIKKDQNQRGFTLFIALIVTSILLTVGFSIGNIILRQLRLSTSGRESQVAFYAADSASECALYWDRKDTSGAAVFDLAFGTSSPTPNFITCGTGPDGMGSTSLQRIYPGSGDNATTTFYIDYREIPGAGTSYNACAKVSVIKVGPKTTIDARGYNAPFVAGICDLSNSRTVERGLLLEY